jgi:hypothetical protein
MTVIELHFLFTKPRTCSKIKMTQHNTENIAISQLWNAWCASMKVLFTNPIVWYIPKHTQSSRLKSEFTGPNESFNLILYSSK